ncbi:MAG: 2,3-bisphosphoglycerate-dependent phosphoglycerate mutase [Parcubacteria group bacterium GW2011_GWF2_38_76]|nr:MAG: 2,3-bisphosphoglycerate-dependent phosphoglycerate mutase [Parcubacteria group bacterium GW2011_GWF2_38_76]HBM45471.1 2,3-diphosphoglycerate-dependent phosphoglycerate mutase [Patescibacteria group bacterium]
MSKLILLRHGESAWNKDNLFTGWTDVPLTDKGREESRVSAKLIKEAGIPVDVAFTSFLVRATETLDIVLKDLDIKNIPVFRSWRLNERHYGALQGLNKEETAEKYGEDQVHIWRRSYTVRPPELSLGDPRDAINDPTYKDLKREEIPFGESLKDTENRVMPYWNENILPLIKNGKNVLVSGHGSGIRSIVKFLDNLSDEEVMNLNIPTGVPLVYEFDENGNKISRYYLGNQEEINKKIESVKNQGKIISK